jgi:hypothetical protein
MGGGGEGKQSSNDGKFTSVAERQTLSQDFALPLVLVRLARNRILGRTAHLNPFIHSAVCLTTGP